MGFVGIMRRSDAATACNTLILDWFHWPVRKTVYLRPICRWFSLAVAEQISAIKTELSSSRRFGCVSPVPSLASTGDGEL